MAENRLEQLEQRVAELEMVMNQDKELPAHFHKIDRIRIQDLDVENKQTYTPSNVTTDRTFDADTVAIAELADIVGTLIADMQNMKLIL